LDESKSLKKIEERKLFDSSYNIEKYSDKRTLQSGNETILRLTIPLVRDNWTVPSTVIDLFPSVDIKSRITGKRLGSKLQIEISIYSDSLQLNLPFAPHQKSSLDNSVFPP